VITFIGIPMAGGLFVLSHDFVHLFLTDKWLPIVPVMKILCIISFFNFINTPTEIAFQASGKPSVGTKISIIQILIIASTIYPLTVVFGLTGTISSVFLSLICTTPISFYYGTKLMKCSLKEVSQPIIVPLISSVSMIIIISGVKEYLLSNVSFIWFGGLVLFGIIIYIGILLVFERYSNYDIFTLIKRIADLS